MLRPTVGELLEGIRQELKRTVLPEVPPGVAARQLRAAIHVLGNLVSTWDQQHRYLAADNEDLDLTLANLAALTGLPRAEDIRHVEDIPGFTDPGLTELATTNLRLQSDLESLQRRWRLARRDDAEVDAILADLHSRMAARMPEAARVNDG